MDRTARFAAAIPAALLLVTAAAAQQRGPSKPPSKTALDGEYMHGHTVTMYDSGTSRPEKVFDTLKLTTAADGALTFELEIAATNGHSCSLQGRAAKLEKFYEYREPLEIPGEPKQECVFRIHDEPRDIVIEDVGGLCRAMNCGARATIGRVAFPKR